jgi:uncharacterized membrane protein
MSTETPPPVTPAASTGEDRTVAVLTYITIIGFIIALIIHSGKKTALGSFHLRQGLGLFVSGIVLSLAGWVLIFIPLLGLVAIWAAWLLMFVMWLMGLIAAANGQQKPTPVLGEYYQKWFSGTFN